MMVRSLPSRLTLALPMGTRYSSSSGISSFLAYSSLCSKTTTGSGSRIADLMRPLASAAEQGATTFRPGKWQTMPSRDWECWPALRRPEPMGIRSTRGIEHWPPDMYFSLAAWLNRGSAQTVTKSSYISSTQGCIPRMAAPTAIPRKPSSEMGVSMTRLGPNSSRKPVVMANTLPITAMSSPIMNILSSRRISSSRPSRMALLTVIFLLILPHTFRYRQYTYRQ